jgi:putative YphP/YqiW family bacilliredoxin
MIMAYDPMLVQPMREELTALGITELRTAADVDAAMAKPGTTMVVVNSVCGCAAGGARPGVAMALKHTTLPDNVVTVFAGQDTEATERARSFFTGVPPSSPSVAIMRDGELVAFMPRHHIEGRSPEMIAASLTSAFDELCSKESA